MSKCLSHQLFLSLGSNHLPFKNLFKAFDSIEHSFDNLSFSLVYESASLKKTDISHYYNVVVRCSTEKSVGELYDRLQSIEEQCGRDRSQSLVQIDIDLLLYDDFIGEFDGIILPRVDILQYAHVLCPLADVFPHGIHPIVQQTYSKLWRSFSDKEESLLLYPVDFFWRNKIISIASAPVII